ncbi:unnamed protein product [Hymenolepis diminuta]|uniref:RGS domain-containing protein n=1 Tax=Hymenolepis diminuta TaxID=6216 RepID=A0A0R3S9Z7_HYMDI|nr:unnamed protein product [Hymenolepis diminuta]
MASGPLVFIHPVLEEGGGGSGDSVAQHSSSAGPSPSPKSSEGGVVLRRVGDDFFYWNAASTTTPTHHHSHQSPPRTQHQTQQQQQGTASSTWELSVNHLLTADHWINSPRGHSDPNLQKKTSGCFSAELTFNNYMCNSSANSSSAIGPTSCTPTPASTGTMTMASPRGGSDWMISWQQQRPSAHHCPAAHPQTQQQGLNNEEDFFNTAGSYQNYAGLGSTATTIVNNRCGFFPNPTPPSSLPPQPQTQPSAVVNSQISNVMVPPRQVSSKTQGIGGESGVGVGGVPPSAPACLPKGGGGGGNGSPSSSTGGGGGGGNRILQSANSIQSVTVFSKHGTGMTSPLNRRPSATEWTVHSRWTQTPGRDPAAFVGVVAVRAPEESAEITLYMLWSYESTILSVRVRPPIESGKRSTHSTEEPHRPEAQLLEPRTSYEEVLSWSESFDNLMRCFTSPNGTVGQKAFREFLRSEYSEENILFWLACEELKTETNSEAVEEKARLIYEDYISILSPKEVSLDSRVREMINTNMTQPTPHTFDEAQLQIYTLMQRDSYPRFLNSRIYKDLLAMTKGETS